MSTASLPDPAEWFRTAGYLGPISIFTPAQCTLLAHRFRRRRRKQEGMWPKSLAAFDRCIYDVATRPSILDRLELLLGPDIVLWGASFVVRQPGQVHAWHTDIESARPEGGFASVWVGIENTNRLSALHLILGSHLYDATVQEMERRSGRRHGALKTDEALAWARAQDPLAEVVQLDMTDGDAVFFDGRLWHGSHNRYEAGPRLALLLQYARATVPVRRPRSGFGFAWPFVFAEEQPPVLAVRGVPDAEVNQVVRRPAAGNRENFKIREKVVPLDLPLEGKPDAPWTPHQLFGGSTPAHGHMNAHASVLQPGHSPHPPHSHLHEEILIVLDGKAEILVGGPQLDSARAVAMTAGSFVYYPAWQFHTIRNVSDQPVSYLMFKWRSAPFEVREPMGVKVHHAADHFPLAERPPGHRRLPLMRQSTNFLGRLKAHLSEMAPGGGYDAHRDRYDVAIIVFSGRLDAGDGVIGPGHVLYYAAGVPHGLRNPGEETARYLVFEFQSYDETVAIEERRRRKMAEAAAAE